MDNDDCCELNRLILGKLAINACFANSRGITVLKLILSFVSPSNAQHYAWNLQNSLVFVLQRQVVLIDKYRVTVCEQTINFRPGKFYIFGILSS
jgi:hypothetical protein